MHRKNCWNGISKKTCAVCDIMQTLSMKLYQYGMLLFNSSSKAAGKHTKTTQRDDDLEALLESDSPIPRQREPLPRNALKALD